MSRTSAVLRDGIILNDRYRIIKQIGQGGFGRAYLAEDTHRYRELCVLKEFAPLLESDRDLYKAKDLFEREAGILYKLEHKQIPKFEALLQTRIDGKRSLFLVQEYIEGKSYWELLRSQGKLSETQVNNMICDLLPVLEYIHSCDSIHRDISPDNLICRDSDGKPVLIDFGCVKIAANAVSQSTGQSVTLIGKKGYSPDEQLRYGQTYPCSDLYSLAATAIVLLTGKQPDKLYDSHAGKWHWEADAQVSPGFSKILNKMLAYKPCDRYQTAAQLRQVLTKENNSVVNSFISRIRTLVVAPGNSENQIESSDFRSQLHGEATRPNLSRLTRIPSQIANYTRLKPWQWGIITATVVLVPGIISFSAIVSRMNFKINDNVEQILLSRNEQDLQQEIYRRVVALDLDPGAFYKNVDAIFHQRYPELKGVQLTQKPEHQQYRQVWYRIANDLLNKQERNRR
ncbi:serine/threonine protein kinase [Chondrocystis sp. NIES-4102]|nr:serine/threonine protein kinase [Chondrocystis sp. NIES-4102]